MLTPAVARLWIRSRVMLIIPLTTASSNNNHTHIYKQPHTHIQPRQQTNTHTVNHSCSSSFGLGRERLWVGIFKWRYINFINWLIGNLLCTRSWHQKSARFFGNVTSTFSSVPSWSGGRSSIVRRCHFGSAGRTASAVRLAWFEEQELKTNRGEVQDTRFWRDNAILLFSVWLPFKVQKWFNVSDHLTNPHAIQRKMLKKPNHMELGQKTGSTTWIVQSTTGSLSS